MSNYLDIEKALIKAYNDLALGLPTSYPAAELDDKQKPDGLWAAVHNIRGSSQPVTLGDQGEDNHPGFMQIDLNYPKNKGSGDLLAKADEILSAFPAGRSLAYNSQEVKVLGTSLSPGRYVGGYYRISLTINYYARTQRNL